MRLQVLGTGSKGNAYLLREGDGSTVLLDAGLPYKDIIKGLNYDLSSLKGVCITHAHQDHSKAVKELSNLGFRPIEQGHAGNWQIASFKCHHDIPCIGFQLRNRVTGHKVVYATDTYQLPYLFPGTTHYIIECNYIVDIIVERIQRGEAHKSLKDRIIFSHMALETLKDILGAQDLSSCQKIILVHLSDDNSDEARMVREIQELTGIETVAAANGMTIDMSLYPF